MLYQSYGKEVMKLFIVLELLLIQTIYSIKNTKIIIKSSTNLTT